MNCFKKGPQNYQIYSTTEVVRGHWILEIQGIAINFTMQLIFAFVFAVILCHGTCIHTYLKQILQINMINIFCKNIDCLSDAVKNIIQYLGMQPCERSDKVPEGKSSHTLYLAGVYRGGHDALVRAKLAVTDSGVTMQMTVRSTDPSVSEVLVSAVG